MIKTPRCLIKIKRQQSTHQTSELARLHTVADRAEATSDDSTSGEWTRRARASARGRFYLHVASGGGGGGGGDDDVIATRASRPSSPSARRRRRSGSVQRSSRSPPSDRVVVDGGGGHSKPPRAVKNNKQVGRRVHDTRYDDDRLVLSLVWSDGGGRGSSRSS